MQVSIGNCADKASHILTEEEAPVKISIYFINRPKKEKMKRKLARALEGALKNVPSSCTVRVPKGCRVPGLWPKKCRAPALQEGKFGAPELHCFTPGLHLAKNSIFVRAPIRERLWAPGSTTKICGL